MFEIKEYLKSKEYTADKERYFVNFKVVDVLYLKKQDKVIIKASNNDVLPFELYEELSDYFKGLLNVEVSLYINAENENLSLCDLTSYVKHYSLKHNCLFKSALPIFKDDKIAITYDDVKHYE